MTTSARAAVNVVPRDLAEDLWAAHRSRVHGLAYRMLGSVSDADDVLQEAYLRLRRTDIATIERPAAWLAQVVSRLCLDELRSARRRREQYMGTWLPEPLVAELADDAVDQVEMAESLSMAFLVLLETLPPAQRVALILHDVFGEDHATIAAVLDRTEVASRHLVSRARAAIRDVRTRQPASADGAAALARAFHAAAQGDDIHGLLRLLDPDVVVRADGGGRAPSPPHPVRGADRAARFLRGVVRRRGGGPEVLASVNGAPGIGLRDDAGHLNWVLSFATGHGGLITDIDIVTNPDKLGHLRTVPPAEHDHEGIPDDRPQR